MMVVFFGGVKKSLMGRQTRARNCEKLAIIKIDSVKPVLILASARLSEKSIQEI